MSASSILQRGRILPIAWVTSQDPKPEPATVPVGGVAFALQPRVFLPSDDRCPAGPKAPVLSNSSGFHARIICDRLASEYDPLSLN